MQRLTSANGGPPRLGLQMREVAYPLDEVAADEPDEEYTLPATHGASSGTLAADLAPSPSSHGGDSLQRQATPMQGSAPATPPPEPNGWRARIPTVGGADPGGTTPFAPVNGSAEAGPQHFVAPSRAIVHMSYCDASKQVVAVTANGGVAVCGAGEAGLSPLAELCFGRWLCGPASGAVCAAVGARALLIAVGRENSEVALYRCGWAPRAEGDCVAVAGRGVAAVSGGYGEAEHRSPRRCVGASLYGAGEGFVKGGVSVALGKVRDAALGPGGPCCCTAALTPRRGRPAARSHRLHPTATGQVGGPGAGPREAPVRTLSLESWGHRPSSTGAVVQVRRPRGGALRAAGIVRAQRLPADFELAAPWTEGRGRS
jgi:hypothetical protein